VFAQNVSIGRRSPERGGNQNLRIHIVRSAALVLALRKLGSPSITTLKLPRQKNHASWFRFITVGSFTVKITVNNFIVKVNVLLLKV
jgi:hypothetical protein